MPQLPSADNNSSIQQNYKSKQSYDFYYQQDSSQLDLWYDTPYYGRVDTEGRIVYPRETFLNVVSQQDDDNQSICLLFVANAFKKMRLHYETLYFDEILDKNSRFFTSKLQVFRGWKSPTMMYSNNQQFLYESFLEEQLEGLTDTPAIKNFDDFVSVLLKYIENKKTPFTRIGFHGSNLLSSFSTGLVLEIYEGEYGNDREAFEFVNDPNFELFEELCKKYGFRIDRNNPWRIIANINSERLQPFIAELVPSENNTVTTKKVFDLFYENLNDNLYFTEFISYLKIFYATFRQAFTKYKQEGFTSEGCKGAFYSYKQRGPVPEDVDTIKALELFYNFRLAETGLVASKKRKKFHIKNVVSIYKSFKGTNKTKALSEALQYIQYNLGTTAYMNVPLEENNLTRINEGVMMSPQDQFNKRTGEDSSYLNDFSDS
tara:strand:- start:217 stop:1509 length:1293 start_codon:yes stop_codon:yes gene_type:complete